MTIFKCEIEIEEFKKAFDGVHSLQLEPLIRIREDGMHMEEVAQGCAYLNIHIPKESFQIYKYAGDMDITVDGLIFSKALKTIKGTLLLATDGNIIKLKEVGSAKTYELRLLENLEKDIPKNFIPEKKFTMKIPTVTMKDMINNAEILHGTGDYKKTMFVVGDGIVFRTEAHDGIAKFSYKLSDEKQKEEFKAVYDLQYLKNVLIPLTGEIATVSFYKNYPLFIEFEGESIKGNFILAPIEEGKGGN